MLKTSWFIFKPHKDDTLTRKVKSEAGDPGWFLEQSNSQGRSLHLSAELKRLRVQLAALSEVGRLEIRVDGYTYFWSGPAEGNTQGVVIAVANELIPSGFNAQLESSRTDFEDVVNPHGWGNRSSINGSRLRQFARQGSLLIP